MQNFDLGRRWGNLERRVADVEAKIELWETAAKTYFVRGAIILAVWGLAFLVNAFPGTTVAQYAEAFRLALMQH